MARFGRPHNNMLNQDMFSVREPGITHPDTKGYIRLRDNGDTEIVVNEGLGIVLNERKGTITMVADEIIFLTSSGDKIRWNHRRLNSQGTVFTQPSLISDDIPDQYSPYTGTEEFYETDA